MATRDEIALAARRLGSPDSCLARILELVGARAFGFDALLRVSSVEWCGEIRNACVECLERPRLLLNPLFVERWCHTPERLATLVLHELAHVSMGHTRLFPRPSVEQNVACDAVINRELFQVKEYGRSNAPLLGELFEDYYVPDESPWFLLRPPPGWPKSPDWNASRNCPATLREIHRRLYDADWSEDPPSGSNVKYSLARHTVLYGEIVDALKESGAAADSSLAGLLGGHGATPREAAALSGDRDARTSEALGDALSKLRSRLAGAGGDPFAHQVELGQRRAALERALGTLLRRAFTADGATRRSSVQLERVVRTVDPRRDRRAIARVQLAGAMGAPRPFLFDGAIIERRPAPYEALVYLDASGSMFGMLPALMAALVPLRRRLRPKLHVFSTTVEAVDGPDFDRGRLPTTGGTSIAPVVKHLLELADRASKAPGAAGRNVLVLTDGWFSPPPPALVEATRAKGLRIHLGIAGEGPLHDDQAWVSTATRLPAIA